MPEPQPYHPHSLKDGLEAFAGSLVTPSQPSASSASSASSHLSRLSSLHSLHEATVLRLISGLPDKSPARAQYLTVFPRLLEEREFVRVVTSKTATDGSAYDVYERAPSEQTYHLTSMLELKYELLTTSGQLLKDSEQESLLDTFFSTMPLLSIGDSRLRRYISVSQSLYWDNTSQSLVSSPVPLECFIRLFDTPPSKAVGGIQSFPISTFDDQFSASLKAQYASLLSILNALPLTASFDDIASLPVAPNLHFILEWADEDLGVYWDIITMLATIFMEKKPLGAYCLIGLTRNGKSSCVNFATTLVGTNNAAGVELSELGDYHKSATLRYALINAPDDEEDEIAKYQKMFKQLAAHQSVKVSKMRSQEPFEVPGSQFTMIFPMNTIPAWKGSSATACAKRTLIIPFNRDFSKSDKAIGNFEEQFFIPQNLCTATAHAMALATFFHSRPEMFGYSKASSEQQRVSLKENGSVLFYKDCFLKYFDGFASWTLLYNDYKLWCNDNEYKYQDKNSLELAFKEYRGESCRNNYVYQTKDGTNSKKARRVTAGLKRRLLMPDAWYEELRMDTKSVHGTGYGDAGESVITALDRVVEERTKWMEGTNND